MRRCRRDRPGLAALVSSGRTLLMRSCLIITVGLLAPIAEAHENFEVFTLKSGRTIKGWVVEATTRVVAIRRSDGGIEQVRSANIATVTITLPGAKVITGQLLGWSDGIYEIQSDGQVVRSPAAHRKADVPETAELPPAEPTRPKAEATGPDILQAAAPPTQIILEAEAKPASEDDAAVLFEVRLSAAADQAVPIIFSTLDRTAKSGSDYEALSGVTSIEPGSTKVEVRVPLLDDDQTEGDEEFELLLTADPMAAVIGEKYIRATISDND